MTFQQRNPSTTWESIPLPTQPPVVIWGWYKPSAAPNGVVLQLPPELWKSGIPTGQLTLRLLAQSAKIEVLIGWTLYGQQIPLNDQTVPWLDAALPPPPDQAPPELILWSPPPGLPSLAGQLAGQPAGFSASGPIQGDLQPGENPAPLFDSIEFHWTNINYAESEIRRTRSQLEQAMAKVNQLNRDLTVEESQASDSLDRQQWQDARRWLRDAAAGLSRCVKEIDVGLLSGAGQRNRFLEIYEKFIKPRQVFPGLKQAAVDFEMLHKSAKNILAAAQTALNKGTSDGERRANTILQRIHQKARAKSGAARSKNA